MSGEQDGGPEGYDLTGSDQDTAGSMGVSSERVGETGPGQHGTTGTRDVSPAEPGTGPGAAPEQAAGGEEVHPDSPVPPKSGYGSHDDRSEEHPYRPGPEDQQP